MDDFSTKIDSYPTLTAMHDDWILFAARSLSGWKLSAVSISKRDEVWSIALSEAPCGAPVICNDRVYLAVGRTCTCYHLEDGTPWWSYETEAPIAGPPALLDEWTLVVTLNNGFMLALVDKRETAVVRWKRKMADWGIKHVGPPVARSPLVAAFVTIGDRVGTQPIAFLMDVKSDHQWPFRLGEVSAQGVTPCLSRDSVYLAGEIGVVEAFKVVGGFDRWWTKARASLSISPCLGDGELYLANGRGDLLALDPRTGRELWVKQNVCVVSGMTVDDGALVCMRRLTNNQLSLYILPPHKPGEPPKWRIEYFTDRTGTANTPSAQDGLYCFTSADPNYLYVFGLASYIRRFAIKESRPDKATELDVDSREVQITSPEQAPPSYNLAIKTETPAILRHDGQEFPVGPDRAALLPTGRSQTLTFSVHTTDGPLPDIWVSGQDWPKQASLVIPAVSD